MINMQIQKYRLGNLRSNCYIVYNKTNAFVVDPGAENEIVSKFLDDKNLSLDFIYITHGHYDHVRGVRQLKDLYPKAIVYAPKNDKYWLTEFFEEIYGYTVPVDSYIDEPFSLDWQDQSIKCYATPGHSLGGMTLHLEKLHILFTGDTLFYETIGRTDIPESDYATLILSIKKIYKLFPDETVVYPGHGKSSMIGHEKKYNPFVNEK